MCRPSRMQPASGRTRINNAIPRTQGGCFAVDPNTLTRGKEARKYFFPLSGKQLISRAAQIRMSLYQSVRVSETRPKIPRVLRRRRLYAGVACISRFSITVFHLDPRRNRPGSGNKGTSGASCASLAVSRWKNAEGEGAWLTRPAKNDFYRGEQPRNNATEFHVGTR